MNENVHFDCFLVPYDSKIIISTDLMLRHFENSMLRHYYPVVIILLKRLTFSLPGNLCFAVCVLRYQYF